jgi:hypothetical protein
MYFYNLKLYKANRILKLSGLITTFMNDDLMPHAIFSWYALNLLKLRVCIDAVTTSNILVFWVFGS